MSILLPTCKLFYCCHTKKTPHSSRIYSWTYIRILNKNAHWKKGCNFILNVNTFVDTHARTYIYCNLSLVHCNKKSQQHRLEYIISSIMSTSRTHLNNCIKTRFIRIEKKKKARKMPYIMDEWKNFLSSHHAFATNSHFIPCMQQNNEIVNDIIKFSTCHDANFVGWKKKNTRREEGENNIHRWYEVSIKKNFSSLICTYSIRSGLFTTS